MLLRLVRYLYWIPPLVDHCHLKIETCACVIFSQSSICIYQWGWYWDSSVKYPTLIYRDCLHCARPRIDIADKGKCEIGVNELCGWLNIETLWFHRRWLNLQEHVCHVVYEVESTQKLYLVARRRMIFVRSIEAHRSETYFLNDFICHAFSSGWWCIVSSSMMRNLRGLIIGELLTKERMHCFTTHIISWKRIYLR